MTSKLMNTPYMGPVHHNTTFSRRFAKDFGAREVMKMLVPKLDRFSKYGMICPFRFLQNLGRSSFLYHIPETFSRTVVQKFFCNLSVVSIHPLQAHFTIDGRMILLNPEVLSQLVVVPLDGLPYCSEIEIHTQGFNIEVAGANLCASPPNRLTHFISHFFMKLCVFFIGLLLVSSYLNLLVGIL
ncbi:hypothetical protein LINGRAHAP2_LOCUS14961 [Linum grandiflorum]